LRQYINACTFRLDDITPDMDWNKFCRIKAIFDKFKIKPLIGIVPDNRDENLKKGGFCIDFWACMRQFQQEGWSIAQHGYHHVYETTDSGILGVKNASEFAGLPYDVQLHKIRAGRDILQKEGLDVTIFMAPGHTFDRTTLNALETLEFTCVTDGYTSSPCYRGNLLFIPCRGARLKMPQGLDTICIHANEYEERDFHELENFIKGHRDRIYSFDEVLAQIWYPKMRAGLKIQEDANLALFRLKKKVADSEACQDFMSETYDEDSRKKMLNRLKGLPKLAGSVLKEQRAKKK